ncbi:DUF5828 family protein [Natronococcus wangiae]|uniref:DUF5828 family protein n=1 Tax=Natronococcus wangiae TaxID=3068275 RepID=UPI00273D1723|nr:DUF5828 family protein [Natronococcus sp. AD5]
MEEQISGFKVVGDWGEVVEHGERITEALRETGVQSDAEYRNRFADALDEWDEWRPKAHESFERDVKEKTAEQASVDEGGGERVGAEPDEDLHVTGEKLSESYTALEDRDVEEAVENGTEAIDHAARAVDSVSRKAVRTVEKSVYRHVMTQIAPCYFDNELVSANVQRPIADDGDRFSFEVNINDDHLKADVSTLLSRYEDEIDRWHVDTEKNTAPVETIEGVEVPPEFDDETRPTKT